MYQDPFDQNNEFPALFRQVVTALREQDKSALGREKSYTEVIKLIQRNLYKILQRTQIPYVDEAETPEIQQDLFFEKLTAKLQAKVAKWEQDNNCVGKHKLKVFLGGGVVRALLGYLYKELLQETRKLSAQPIAENYDYKPFAIFMHESMQEPEYHLRRLSMLRDTEKLYKEFVLGVGSDLDLYIELEPQNTVLEEILKHTATDFINSVETKMGLRDLHGAEKHTFLPIADVKVRGKQLKYSYEQGGASIDWLSLELTTPNEGELALRGPEFIQDFNIMYDFIDGCYRYIQGIEPAEQKQIIRGLRALLEIPFLSINDVDVIQNQLDTLDMKNLSPEAKQQIDKLIRNAYISGANNRAYREKGLLSKLAQNHLIPIFAINAPITANRIVTGKYSNLVDGLLIPYAHFLNQYCDNENDEYRLYHGTPENINLLYILRGGFVASVGTMQHVQGRAGFGTGVYTSKKSTAKVYGRDGVLLRLNMIPNSNTRVFNLDAFMRNPENVSLLQNEAKVKGYDDLSDLLRICYNVDAIVAGGDEVVVMNTKVFELTDIREMLGILLHSSYRNMLSTTSRWDIFDSIMSFYNLLELSKMLHLQSEKLDEYALALKQHVALVLDQNLLPLRICYKLFSMPSLIAPDALVEEVIKYCNAHATYDYASDDPGSMLYELNAVSTQLRELAANNVISSASLRQVYVALLTWHLSHGTSLEYLLESISNETFIFADLGTTDILIAALHEASFNASLYALIPVYEKEIRDGKQFQTITYKVCDGTILTKLNELKNQGKINEKQEQEIIDLIFQAAMRWHKNIKLEIANLDYSKISRFMVFVTTLDNYLKACQDPNAVSANIHGMLVNILNVIIDRFIELQTVVELEKWGVFCASSSSTFKLYVDVRANLEKLVAMDYVSAERATKLIAVLERLGIQISETKLNIQLR